MLNEQKAITVSASLCTVARPTLSGSRVHMCCTQTGAVVPSLMAPARKMSPSRSTTSTVAMAATTMPSAFALGNAALMSPFLFILRRLRSADIDSRAFD